MADAVIDGVIAGWVTTLNLCEESCCSWSLPCFEGFSPGSPVFLPP